MNQNIFLIFILLLPIFGKSIDFVESIFFFGISLFFFCFFFKRKYSFLKKKNIIILIILTILLLISTISSKNIGISYYQFFTYLTTIFLFILAVNFIEPEKFKKGIVVFSFFYSIVFLLNKIGIISLVIKPFNDNFILQVWGHSYISTFVIFAIPILIEYLSNKTLDRNKKYFLLTSLLIILISLFLANSRSSIFALLFSIPFLKTQKPFSSKIKIGSIVLLILFFAFSFFFVWNNKSKNKTFFGDRHEYFKNAIIGFSKSPIFGNGPSAYSFINQKYRSNVSIYSSLSHNSLLEFLSEEGIIFTLLFFISVFLALKKTFKSNNLFFVCSITAILNSFLDPTWDYPGIFIISLYFIFFYSFDSQKHGQSKIEKVFINIITITLLLFFFSKTFSDILFLSGKFKQSLLIDPFNLNSRIEIIKRENPKTQIWKKNLDFLLVFFKNRNDVYQALTKTLPFPENEIYYFKIFELNPKGNSKNYFNLINSYQKNNLQNKLNNLLVFIAENSDPNQFTRSEKIALKKIFYNTGIKIFSSNPQISISLLKQCLIYDKDLSHFYIELANLYWHSGQKSKAVDQINLCLKIKTSQKHCQWYLENFQNQFQYPGQKEFADYINQVSN